MATAIASVIAAIFTGLMTVWVAHLKGKSDQKQTIGPDWANFTDKIQAQVDRQNARIGELETKIRGLEAAVDRWKRLFAMSIDYAKALMVDHPSPPSVPPDLASEFD